MSLVELARICVGVLFSIILMSSALESMNAKPANKFGKFDSKESKLRTLFIATLLLITTMLFDMFLRS